MKSVLVSHPLGNQVVRALITRLLQHDALHSYYTTVNIPPQAPWLSLLPSKFRQELLRRSYEIPGRYIKSRSIRELVRQVSQRLGWHSLILHESGWASIDAIYRDADKWVASSLKKMELLPEVVYCYEDAACDTFRVAGKLDIRRVYEITIGHYAAAQKIMKEEADSMPEFASTIEALWDSEEKLKRKDEEIAQSDHIIASSDFVRQTLLESGVASDKISVVQYGSPDSLPAMPEKRNAAKDPLRLLFAGRIGQRKGIGYLLKAMQQLDRKDVELILMGEIVGNPEVYRPYEKLFRYQSPRPYNELLSMMQSCDMLVLPTLFEGQALVILEAMRCGLPILTTPNSGATNLIQDQIEGFIVPIRSVDALVEKIQWAVDHRDLLYEMGQSARKRAEKCSWDNYAEVVASSL